MRSLVCGMMLAVAGSAAMAGGSAVVACSSSNTAVLRVNYSVPDAGLPGLFWFGVLTPDQTAGGVLTPNGWEVYQGGLYPFYGRYDTGLPGTIAFEIPFPNSPSSTIEYVGYTVYAGHGAYTAKAKSTVAMRRASLDAAKPERVKAGRWNVAYDSDEQFIWSLVQKDMKDGNKYVGLTTIPFVDCSPNYGN